jgi:sugar/nucleoside kinase (ribokinase family)
MNERGAAWVVITDGRNPVHVRSHTGLYRLQPLEREVLNPIGCGDCLAGALAAALYQGLDPLSAVRYGLAAAADKVGRLLPGQIDRESVAALADAITVTRL